VYVRPLLSSCKLPLALSPITPSTTHQQQAASSHSSKQSLGGNWLHCVDTDTTLHSRGAAREAGGGACCQHGVGMSERTNNGLKQKGGEEIFGRATGRVR
jgi:hypothetical protein